MFIDLFFIQNLIYDYLILSGVAILVNENFNYPRLILGLLISLCLSMLMFMYFPAFLTITPLLTLRIVFGKRAKKRYFKSVIYFYFLSMFLNGVFNTITSFMNFGMTMIPYMLTTLGLSVIVTLIYVIKARWISEQEIVSQFTHEVRIFCGRVEITGSGFVDTGNHLVDNKTANPVMIVPKEKLATNSVDEFLAQHRIKTWETEYAVINENKQSLLVFKPTLLIINDTIVHNVVVGVVENSFVKYDFLLQPSIIKNI